MKRHLLLLAAALWAVGAQASESDPKQRLFTDRKKPEETAPEKLKRHEFSFWLSSVAQELKIPLDIVNLLHMMNRPDKVKAFHLAQHIAEDDSLTRRTLFRLESLLEKNGRLNPLDVQLLSSMRSAMESKRELADRFATLAKSAGLPEKAPDALMDSWSSALSAVEPPKTGDLRYDVETGVWERYDEGKSDWQAFDPHAK